MNLVNIHDRATPSQLWLSLVLIGVVFLCGCRATLEPNTGALEAPESTIAERSISSADGESPSASNNLPAQPTLEDYLSYAVRYNSGLEAAFNRWKAALEKIPQVKALPDPKFTYGYFIDEVETRVGPQEHRYGLSQMFPWFGKRGLREDIATAEARAAEQAYQTARLKLYYEVKEAYYEYYYLHRAIVITEDNVRLLKNLETVAQAGLQGGASLSGVTQAQVELGKLEDQLRTLQDFRGPIAARLNAALNRPFDSLVPEPTSMVGAGLAIDEANVFSTLIEANPELRGLQFSIAREAHALELAKKDYYPDFMLGVDYIQTDNARMSGVSDSGKDPIIAMFSINLPIWWDKYQAEVGGARARKLAAEKGREDRANLLQSDLQMAVYRFRDAERKIGLYSDALIPQAETALNVAEQSYSAGKAEFLNLIDAQRLLLNFQLEYERALANREQRIAEIEMLIGQELPRQSSAEAQDFNHEKQKEP